MVTFFRSLSKPRSRFGLLFTFAFCLFSIGVACEVYQWRQGLGVANFDNPHVWGLYIATFIFWIGMSHSGTLLSAILHIIHADWRKPIYRFAEAMTDIFADDGGPFRARPLGPALEMLLLPALS